MSLELIVGTTFYAVVAIAMLIRDSKIEQLQKQIWEAYLSLLKESERQREELTLIKQELREMRREFENR